MFNSWMFYIILGLSATVGALGWLSLSLHDNKLVAVEALKEAREAVAGYQKSLNLQIKSCEVSDAITSEYQSEKQVQQDKTQATVTAIDKLSSKPQKVVKDEVSDVVDIDGKLPSELISLLSKASDSNQRGSNPDAK